MLLKLRYLYRAYRYRLRVDPAELRFICSHLKAGEVAADIGCHKGAYTYWMRRTVGPSGAVFAFEPQPKQVDYLRSVFSAMSYDNVVVVPMAVSSAPGKLPLHVPCGSGETHAATLEGEAATRLARRRVLAGALSESVLVDVPVTTLDLFFSGNRPPNLLKIDVEGHELAVLEGARETLVRFHPAVLIECEARHRADNDVRTVFDLLQSCGYSGSFFQNGDRRSIDEFDPEKHQRMASDAISPPRGYINNFVFVYEK